MSELLFINACKDKNNAYFIKKKYDIEVDYNFSQEIIKKDNNNIVSPDFQNFYESMKKTIQDMPKKTIITVSDSSSIHASTIPAINDKFMKQSNEDYSSELAILIIDSNPSINDYHSTNNTYDIINSSLMGVCNPTLTNHRLLINPEQLILYGINQNNDNIDQLYDYDISSYTLNKIKSNDPKQFAKLFHNINKPFHIVINSEIFFTGITIDNILPILQVIKNNIVSFDIINFDINKFGISKIKLLRDIFLKIFSLLFNIQEKTINIFTEDTSFLIYRPMTQESPLDIAWYILDFVDLETHNRILQNIPDDGIITIDIGDNPHDSFDNDILLAKTTINEQKLKSIYTSHKITDMALASSDKEAMLFKLLDTTPLNIP